MSDFADSPAPAREAAAAKRRQDLSDDDLEEQRLSQSESKHKQAMYLASYQDYSQLSESRGKKKTKKRKKSPRRAIRISPEKEKRYAELSRKRNAKIEAEERPMKVTTQETFERLSANSIEKKDRVTTQVNEFKRQEHQMFGSASPKCNSRSNELADRKMLKELDRHFDQSEGELTRSELASKLCQLGMLGERQKLESQPLLKEKLKDWAIEGSDPDLYDASKVKTSLKESILAPSPSKFDSLVCISIIASLTRPQTATPEESRSNKSRMSLEAIERLSTARHKTPKRPWKRIRDPIYFGYREPPPPPTMSPKSVELLENIEDAKIPFVERDELMTQRRKADFKRAVRTQIRESRKLAMTATPKAQKPPQNTDTPLAPAAPPEIKPDPVRRPRFKESEHPAGWDAAINRGRIACAKRTKAFC